MVSNSQCVDNLIPSFVQKLVKFQWRIQDFPEGAPTPEVGYFAHFFAESCMKMKEFGPRGRPWIHQ